MNKAMMILSLAAVAGMAHGQYKTGSTKSEQTAQDVKQHFQEQLEEAVRVRGSFAGMKDGKAVVPLRIADGHNATMEINNDESNVKVVQDGDHIVVDIDGVEVYNGRLDADFERFTLVGVDGVTEVELINAKGSPNVMFMERFGEDDVAVRAEIERALGLAEMAQGKVAQQYALAFSPQSHPKVMMGVTLEGVGESTAKQLGIDRESATLIGTVMEGLPAGKAGLEAHDIVVSVDGLGSANPKEIREVIAGKEPGDTLVLDVLRGGHPHQVILDLEAYDAEALGTVNVGRSFAFAPGISSFELDDENAEERFGEWLQKLVDEREELQERMKEVDGTELAKLRERSAMVSDQIAEMRDKIAAGDFTMPRFPGRLHTWSWAPDGDNNFTFDLDLDNMPNVQFAPGDGGHAFVVPGQGNAEIKVLVEKLEQSANQHEVQVREMELRIRELEAQLERAIERLENEQRDNGPDA